LRRRGQLLLRPAAPRAATASSYKNEKQFNSKKLHIENTSYFLDQDILITNQKYQVNAIIS
jgi:hypothetical protein